MLFSGIAKAQWTGSTIATNTNGDVNIGTTSTQGNLTIFRAAESNIGNVITYPKPALSIQVQQPIAGTTCIGCTYANTQSPIFEINSSSYTYGGGGTSMGGFLGYKSPIFAIGGDCQLKVGGLAKPYFNNAIYGSSYLDGNNMVRGKLRVSSNPSLITSFSDWATANFPFSFAVEDGNSRFVNNVLIGSSSWPSNSTNYKLEVDGSAMVKGKLRIGDLEANSTYSNYALSVYGEIVCRKAVVQINSWADYVFKPDFKLKSILEVENFINDNGRLPEMSSEEEIIFKGLDLAEIQKQQQQKIEELMLYIIELKKEVEQLKFVKK